MLFAANYSPLLANMAVRGEVPLDLFKCPFWENVIAEAQTYMPVYVHFPLSAGRGIGTPINREQNRPADWEAIERTLESTGTSQVNIHLIVPAEEFPEIPIESIAPGDVSRVIEKMIVDVSGAVARWGADRVIVELGFAEAHHLKAAILPEVAQRVTQATGCGFLLDASHARLASLELGMQPQTYIEMLPLDRLREVHITGTHLLEGELAERLRKTANGRKMLSSFEGCWMDHLSMQDHDWELFTWCMDQIHAGAWTKPDLVSFEYGGVKGFWEEILDENVLLEQLPRLYAGVHNHKAAV